MAQYYNVVTNPNGTYTIEDFPQLCSLDGQRVQFVIEDNNGSNVVSQPILYTTTTDNNETTLFSQINLGAHVGTTQLEARPSVYIIKTNDSPIQQNVFTKVETNNVPSDNKEVKDQINICYAPAQFSNNESIELVIKKDPSPVKTVTANFVRCQQQTATPTSIANRNIVVQGSDKKQPTRLVPLNKSVAGVTPARGILKTTLQGANTPTAKAGKMRRASTVANSPNVAVTTLARASTGNVAVPALVSPPRGPQARPPIHCEATPRLNNIQPATARNSATPQTPEPLISLSERIRQNSLKQRQQNERQLQQQKQPPPVMVVAPTTRLIQPTQAVVAPRQQQQQQQQRNMGSLMSRLQSQQSQQQQQQLQQQQQQQMLQQQQLQQQLQLQQQQLQLQRQQQQQLLLQRQTAQQLSRQVQAATVTVSDAEEPMEVEGSETMDPLERLNQLNSSKSESEENSSESVAYLQQEIDDPTTAIVQQQITGNEAKMLVILENGEQRLITFEVPKEDCTVQDLLEQANILSSQEPRVSLVSDPTLGINYIVDVTKTSTYEEEQQLESASSDASSVTTTVEQPKTPIKNNANLPPATTPAARGPPKYISGMLAVCPYCGMSASDFNTCLRCKRKLPDNVRSIPVSSTPKKDSSSVSVDTFYKKVDSSQKLNHETAAKRGRGRGRGGASTRTPRQNKEPECLTISSDEEDENKKQKQHGIKEAPDSLNLMNNQESDGILEKEPNITAKTISALKAARISQAESGVKEEITDSPNLLTTSLLCRTVRIGSYKYIPTDNVELTSNGLKLEVPLLEDDKNFITVDIKLEDLIAVLMHFQKSMPVLFFYPDVQTGLRIRDLLGMQDPKGPYFDPASTDNTHKRITLLPEKISDESKVILRHMYKDVFTELNSKEANDILVRASPKSAGYPRSFIQTRSETKKVTSANSTSSNGEIQTITVYPAPPAKGGIAINTEDYVCLAEDQFLNDVIIDFYLKYLMLEVLSHDHDRTHVFSSYFYKRLTSPHSQAGGNTENLSAAARRHARVQKWTKNVNIFEKDFIVIPINEHAHWFLAIICFPGLVGKVTQKVEAKTISQKLAEKKKKDAKAQAPSADVNVTIGSTTITQITIDPNDDGSERDEAEGDEDEIESDSEEEEETESKASTEQATASPQIPDKSDEINKVPCILIFDSLAGASRVRVVATLRDYLSCEYKAKVGSEKEFSKNTIKGACPKVPQQSNYTDCGLYVLQYVESFFKTPIKNYKLPIKTLKNWFEEIVVTRKREEIANLLKNLVSNTKRTKPLTLPSLTFPTQDGKLKKKPESETKEAKAAETDEKKKAATTEAGESQSNEASSSSEKVEGNSSESSTQVSTEEPLTDATDAQKSAVTPTAVKSSSDAMAFLKNKRIPRLQKSSEDPEDKQAAKKHKGDSFDSCK